MYIMCVRLFNALSRRVCALQISIIIIIIKLHRAYVTMIQGIKMHRAYVTTIQGTKRPFCLNAYRLTDIAAFPIVSRVEWPLNYVFMHI